MQLEFKARIATTAEKSSTICARFRETVFQPFEQYCRARGVRFSYAPLNTINGSEILVAPCPIFFIVGDVPWSNGPWRNGARGRLKRNGNTARGGRSVTDAAQLIKLVGEAADHVYIYAMEPGIEQPVPHQRTGSTLEKLVRPIPESRRVIVSGIASDDDLAKSLLEGLHDALNRRYPLLGATANVAMLRARHDAFVESYCDNYRRVPELFNQLDAFALESSGPLLVTGNHDVGKTALLVNWSNEYLRFHPGTIVIRHFMEADGEGADHGPLLHHILGELHQYEMPDGAPPATLADMEDRFRAWAIAERDTDVIVIIDGLERLCSRSRELHWMPRSWSPRCFFLLSATLDGVDDAALGRWRRLTIESLPPDVNRMRLRRLIDQDADASNDDIAFPGGTTLPVLPLSSEEPQSEELERIVEIVLGGGVASDSLVDYLLKEKQRLTTLERKVLCAIWSSRRGLTFSELHGLTSVSRAKLDSMQKQLPGLIVRRGEMITFGSSVVHRGVERCLVRNEREAKRLHWSLAHYFTRHADVTRRAEEVPWQWYSAEDWEALASCLEDLSLFAIIIDEGRAYELQKYWRELGGNPVMTTVYRNLIDRRLASLDLSGGATVDPPDLLERMAIFFSECGAYQSAAELLEQSIDLLERYGRTDIPATIRRCAALGEIWRRAGRYRAAIALLTRALELCPDLPEPDHELHAQVLNDLGLTMCEANLPDALEYFRDALRIRLETFGLDHPTTAETLNDMALAYQNRQNYRAAIALYERALAIQRQHNDAHPRVATYLNNLAAARNGLGHRATALTLYMQALQILEQLFGLRHPQTLVSRTNVAACFYRCGQIDDAYEICIDVRSDIIEALNDSHPHYLVVSVNVAQLFRALGRHDEAEELLLTTLGTCKRVLGDDHTITGTCAQNIAGLYRALRQFDEAWRYYEYALAIWYNVLDPYHPRICTTLLHLTKVVEQLGEYWVAAYFCSEAYRIRKETLGSDDAQTIETFEWQRSLVTKALDARQKPETLLPHRLYRLALFIDDIDVHEAACILLGYYIENHPDADAGTLREARARLVRRGG